MKRYRSFSPKETKQFAAELARRILRRKRGRRATVVALKGALGSGKTTFVQGFFRGLGIRGGAASPTFILARRSRIGKGKFQNIFHLDAYRLRGPEEFLHVGLGEILKEPKNIVLIEWADKAKRLIPPQAAWIEFRHGKKENQRIIRKLSK